MNARSITLLAGLLLLGGCAAKAPSTPVMTESDPAVVSLNEAAMRVARAAEQAALAQSADSTLTRTPTPRASGQ